MDGKSSKGTKRKTHAFEARAATSRADHITSQILEAILNGELRPGDFVGTESGLAGSFDSSRLPVREALKRLSAVGAINITTGASGGARVADADADSVSEVLAVQFALAGATTEEVLSARLAIEPIAVRIAAERATDDDIQELETLIERAEQSTNKADSEYQETAANLLAIHSALVEASHNQALSLMISGLIQLLLKTYLEYGGSQEIAKQGLGFLREIVRNIADQNPDAAERISRKHLEGQMRLWLEISEAEFKKRPDALKE